jgi:D-glycero-alpha-D-manno-heptose 1-phosphate guanylyltransferase
MIKTAVILAGGFGTRLKEVVKDVPKPMAPVNGTPFLAYVCRYLKKYDIKNIIFSTGYLSEKIETYFHENFEGVQTSYSKETTPLGTGGAVRLAIKNSRDEEILVLNGDSFFDVPLDEFYKKHNEKNGDGSLALRYVLDTSRYGTIDRDEQNKIICFQEKTGTASQGFINGGVYIIKPSSFLKNTPSEGPFSIEKDFFEKQVGQLDLYGFEYSGYFIDIGIPADYMKAQHDFKEFKY